VSCLSASRIDFADLVVVCWILAFYLCCCSEDGGGLPSCSITEGVWEFSSKPGGPGCPEVADRIVEVDNASLRSSPVNCKDGCTCSQEFDEAECVARQWQSCPDGNSYCMTTWRDQLAYGTCEYTGGELFCLWKQYYSWIGPPGT
jgi:hypothetical protein